MSKRLLARAASWLGSHPATLFVLWSLWLSIFYFGLGGFSYVHLHDNGDGLLPFHLSLAQAFTNGQIGYWDLLRVGGVDRLASIPTKLGIVPFTVLPGWLAYGAFLWLQRFIAGYMTFRLLRDSLETELRPAIYAGFTYSLFSQSANNSQWDGFTLYDGLALPGLALLLWALDRIDLQKTIRPFLCAAGIGILLSLSSLSVFVVFLFPIIVLWFWIIVRRRQIKFWMSVLVMMGAWLLTESQAVWATLLDAPLSHRASWIPNSTNSYGLSDQIAFAVGLIKDNVVALALAVAGWIMARRREPRVFWLMTTIATVLIFVGGYSFVETIIFSYFRWLSTIQFTRISLVVPFLATVAGAIALHAIDSERRLYGWPLQKTLFVATIGILGLQSIAVNAWMFKEILLGRNFSALYEQPSIRQLADKTRNQMPFRVATVSTSAIHPAFAWAYGFESADGYLNLYSRRYFDYWKAVIAPLTSSDQVTYNYFHYWGNRVYLFEPTQDFPSRSDVRFEDYYDLKLLSLANVRYIISGITLRGESLSLVSASERDHQFACSGPDQTRKLFAMMRGECMQGSSVYIYENRLVLPRFFLAQHAEVFTEVEQQMRALSSASYGDLRSTAYLGQDAAKSVPVDQLNSTTGTVDLVRYSSDQIALDVQTDGASILVVTNSYHRYWEAWVDDSAAKVFPVDHAFQGVYIPRGQHHVILQYMPPYAIRFNQ